MHQAFREEQQKWIQQLQKEKDTEEDEDLEEEDMELPVSLGTSGPLRFTG